MMGISGTGPALDDLAEGASAPPLDSAANQLVNLFARIMIRCGYDKGALQEGFDRALTASAISIPRLAPAQMRELPEAPHLITLWTSLQGYVDEHNNPIALPLRGRGNSIQALARRINPALDLEELLRYLLHTDTVRKIGRRYVLSRRWIMLRGVPGSAHSRTMRGLLGAFRTHEHNLLAKSDAESWFEFTVENPCFPVSKLDELDQHARRTGLGKLRKIDLFMRHCEAHRDRKEPTVWVGFGMHRFQHELSTVFAAPPARSLRPSRRGVGKRR